MVKKKIHPKAKINENSTYPLESYHGIIILICLSVSLLFYMFFLALPLNNLSFRETFSLFIPLIVMLVFLSKVFASIFSFFIFIIFNTNSKYVKLYELEYYRKKFNKIKMLNDRIMALNSINMKASERAFIFTHNISTPLGTCRQILSSSLDKNLAISREKKTVMLSYINNMLIQANQYTDFYKARKTSPSAFQHICCINDVIQSLIYQFKEKISIKNLLNDVYSIIGNSFEINAIFSNLISNAIEECSIKNINSKEIVISFSVKDNYMLVNIEDSCGGINKKIQEQIGKKIVSDKPGSNGIGIFSALNNLKKYYGEYKLESPNHINGTTWMIKLPIMLNNVYKTKIKLLSNTRLVIFESKASKNLMRKINDANLDAYFFSQEEDFLSFVQKNRSEENIYLVSNDLNIKEKGIDLIEKINIQENTFVLTQNHSDEYLIKKCMFFNIKIIPLNYSKMINIIIGR